MFRGVTARTVVSLLAVVLHGPQVFASTASFASARTARHAMGKSQPGIKPSGKGRCATRSPPAGTPAATGTRSVPWAPATGTALPPTAHPRHPTVRT